MNQRPSPDTLRTPPPPPFRMLGNAAVAGVLAVARPLARFGLHHAPDGWRRMTEIALRYEASKFALSSFGLDLWSDAPPAGDVSNDEAERHLLRRLHAFLRDEPIAQCTLAHRGSASVAAPKPGVDVARARFDATGTLAAIDVLLDDRYGPYPPDDAARDRAAGAAVGAYNDRYASGAAHPPNADRPEHPVSTNGHGTVDRVVTRRMLGAILVAFEPQPADPAARFVAPAFDLRRGMPLAPLNVIARMSADGRSADLWVQVHHAAADGAPAQEMLTRLEEQWGVREPVTYPAPASFGAGQTLRRCSTARSPREVWSAQDFVDFAPLIALRQELLERPDVRAGGGITLATLLVWCLAHQPEFRGRKFASTVDIPAAGDGRPRGVNFLSIRPGEFFSAMTKPAAMVAYAHEAARLLEDTRRRASPPCVATDTMALLPPGLQLWSFRRNLDTAAEIYGSVGLSVIRDAKVFVCPISDLGFEDGFIGVGNMLLPAAGGETRVGAVSVKGPREKVAAYPQAIRRAVANCREYV